MIYNWQHVKISRNFSAQGLTVAFTTGERTYSRQWKRRDQVFGQMEDRFSRFFPLWKSWHYKSAPHDGKNYQKTLIFHFFFPNASGNIWVHIILVFWRENSNSKSDFQKMRLFLDIFIHSAIQRRRKLPIPRYLTLSIKRQMKFYFWQEFSAVCKM